MEELWKWFVDNLSSEWHVVVRAPVPVLIMATLLYLFARWERGRIIANQRSQIANEHSISDNLRSIISLKDQELATVKNAAGSIPEVTMTSLADIERQIADHNRDITKLSARRLEAHQRDRITQTASQHRSKIYILSEMGASDGPMFMSDLAKAFRDAGWEVDTAVSVPILEPSESGLFVVIPEGAIPVDPPQQFVLQALRDAGLDFNLERLNMPDPSPVKIVITPRA